MATIPIRFTLTAAETAASITTLTRSDTGFAPSGVSLPIALANTSGNVWTGSFVDASPAPSYQAVAQITFANGRTGLSPAFAVAGAAGPAGMYATISDGAGVVSQDNIDLWSKQREADSPNLSQQQGAFNLASAYIVSEFSKNKLLPPAPLTVSAAPLVLIEARMMVCHLYSANGIADKATGRFGKLTSIYDSADDELQELLYYNRGGFTRASGYSDAPVGVGPTVDASGRNVGAAPPWPRPVWNGSFWTWG
jgi:hypothetical protein